MKHVYNMHLNTNKVVTMNKFVLPQERWIVGIEPKSYHFLFRKNVYSNDPYYARKFGVKVYPKNKDESSP